MPILRKEILHIVLRAAVKFRAVSSSVANAEQNFGKFQHHGGKGAYPHPEHRAESAQKQGPRNTRDVSHAKRPRQCHRKSRQGTDRARSASFLFFSPFKDTKTQVKQKKYSRRDQEQGKCRSRHVFAEKFKHFVPPCRAILSELYSKTPLFMTISAFSRRDFGLLENKMLTIC